MLWRGRKRTTPIGMDIGSAAVKAAQLRGVPGEWEVSAMTFIAHAAPAAEGQAAGASGEAAEDAASAPAARAAGAWRPDAPAASGEAVETAQAKDDPLAQVDLERIVHALRRQGFVGQEVAIAVPNDRLRSGIIELPARSSGAPLEQIARMETATMHRLEPGAFELAWWELPATQRQHDLGRAMVAACAHVDADRVVERFAEHGLEVVAMDVPASALVRLAADEGEDEQQVLGLLDFGAAATTLVIVYQGRPIYTRRLAESGFGRLERSLGEQFGLEPAVTRYLLEQTGLSEPADATDALPPEMRHVIEDHLGTIATELQVSLSYARHQYPSARVKSVMLMGGGARIPGLADTLNRQLGHDVRALTPADRVPAEAAMLKAAGDPGLCLATALAMRDEEEER